MRFYACFFMIVVAACTSKPAGEKDEPVKTENASPGVGYDGPEIPKILQSCALPPDIPSSPRTVEIVGAYARDMRLAFEDCAYRLRRLNDFIKFGH